MTNDRVRFVKAYTNHVGRAFMRFSLDGREDWAGVRDICVREDRQALTSLTRREAREVARTKFAEAGQFDTPTHKSPERPI